MLSEKRRRYLIRRMERMSPNQIKNWIKRKRRHYDKREQHIRRLDRELKELLKQQSEIHFVEKYQRDKQQWP